jgi:hyperosmotically inducible periplasmic protein
MKTSFLPALLISGLMLAPAALLALPTDHDAEKAIKQSYTYRATLDNKVKVDVDDGVATLTGKVRDDEQSRIAEDTASETPGVNRVVNKLKIAGEAKPGSDEWIALKIRSRLLVKANVSLTDTKVEVRDGVVYLTGTADSTAQKELTEEYVKDLDGVRSVKNDIQVVDRAAMKDRDRDHVASDKDRDYDRDHRNSAGEKIDDSSITAQVKYELFSHRGTSALKTKVNTNGGHVVISGDANNDAEKSLVTKLAKSVRGVESVDNNMTVRN